MTTIEQLLRENKITKPAPPIDHHHQITPAEFAELEELVLEDMETNIASRKDFLQYLRLTGSEPDIYQDDANNLNLDIVCNGNGYSYCSSSYDNDEDYMMWDACEWVNINRNYNALGLKLVELISSLSA